MSQLQLSSNHTFNFELLRVMGAARSFGADIGELLRVATQIEAGNFESWHDAFYALAEHVAAQVPGDRYPVSARNALFRAASYYRSADFFIHGNPADPRINRLWDKQTTAFDKAISLMDIPGQRVMLDADGFNVPAILFKAAKDDQPRPTLLLCNGYDGSQEEMLHVFGFGALERGYNVVTFEGPGQPSVVRAQQQGFISEWEKVVSPVVDFCEKVPGIDAGKIFLLGYSFGGWLAPRAAAFEHRLAGIICVDGLYDIHKAFTGGLPDSLLKYYNNGDYEKFDNIIRNIMQQDVAMRWAVDQGCWAFMADSPSAFLNQTKEMTLEHIAPLIQCPVLVGEAAADHFFQGQPALLAAALGNQATFFHLGAEDAAHEHCHVGATDLLATIVMNWMQDQL